MKKWLPWIIVAAAAGAVLSGLRAPRDTDFAWQSFGRIPVLANGRFQPLDSLAQNALLQLREKSTAISSTAFSGPDKQREIPATQWLAEVIFQPEVAEMRPVFRIDNLELKQTLGLPVEARRGDEGGREALFPTNRSHPRSRRWRSRRGRRRRGRKKRGRPRRGRGRRIPPKRKPRSRLPMIGPCSN